MKVYLVLCNSVPNSAWSYEWEAETERDRLEDLVKDSVYRYIITVLEMQVREL